LKSKISLFIIQRIPILINDNKIIFHKVYKPLFYLPSTLKTGKTYISNAFNISVTFASTLYLERNCNFFYKLEKIEVEIMLLFKIKINTEYAI
jgi:hypothetical protein